MESNESPIVNSATLTQVLPFVILLKDQVLLYLVPSTRYFCAIKLHFAPFHTLCITSSRKHWSTRLSMSTAACDDPKDESEGEFEGEQASLYNSTKLPGCDDGDAPE